MKYLILLIILSFNAAADEKLRHSFLNKYCFDCHDSELQKGKVNLENQPADWSKNSSGEFWENVAAVLENDYMPPADKKKQPSVDEKKKMLQSVHKLLTSSVKPGGTGLRLLSKQEYQNSIRSIFRIRYEVPPYYPESSHSLKPAAATQLSEPLMQSYHDMALEVANRILPPYQKKVPVKIVSVKGNGDQTRLVSSAALVIETLVKEKQFIAKKSGEYRVSVKVKPFRSADAHYSAPKSYTLQILSVGATSNIFQPYSVKSVRKEFSVQPVPKWQTFTADIRMEEGDAIAWRWKNGPLISSKQNKKMDERLVAERTKDKRFLKAWNSLKVKRGLDGVSIYREVKKFYDKNKFPNDKNLLKTPKLYAVQSNEFVSYFRGELQTVGPALDVSLMAVKGPLKVYESKREKEQKWITENFLGQRKNLSDQEYYQAILRPLISKAFRRPASQLQVEKYVRIALNHKEETGKFEDGAHLAVRAVLCSPEFLFIYPQSEKLDNYDLATRLSFFLTLNPPDARLQKTASSGNLQKSATLEKTVRSILSSNKSSAFIRDFLGKWLETEKLHSIMPDPRLKRFINKDRSSYINETEMFFTEILRKNLPMKTFIDPDFAFVNRRTAKDIYGLKQKFGDEMKKVSIPRGGRRGGLLTMPAVLMATANGVDTQPVIRGVWLLHNIFGWYLPNPPSSVPALEPDTSKAETIKQQVLAHTQDTKCAGCHVRIDPLGFALENFDPIGRWRSNYPKYEEVEYFDQTTGGKKIYYKTVKGKAVEADSVMNDGTKIKDIVDLKKYAVKNIDAFSNCLAQKLMTYATGRKLNYADKKVIAQAVQKVKQNNGGFQDLFVELVKSEVFLTR